MRQLSTRLVRNLRPCRSEKELIPAIGEALSHVRGRPVRLRQAAFPPATASGIWVDLIGHDLIAYEENTDPEHQLVIIGHEAWHMFEGHGGTGTGTGHDTGTGPGHGTTASRARRGETADALAEFVTLLREAADTGLPPGAPMDAALHFAARTDARHVHEELDAERFGCRFATDVLAALEDAYVPHDPRHIAGRIQATMAHRFRQV